MENLINELNSIDDNIKFTYEVENIRKLNYMDVNVTRKENNIFETTVCKKPGSSKEIINSRCRIPYSNKIASLRSYINRALFICSNKMLINAEFKIIEDIARNNGYIIKEQCRKLYTKIIKTFNVIQPGQKSKKKNTIETVKEK